MYRGMIKFVCDDCGHKFEGMDCEYCASVYTAPVKCPKCGSWHTMPSGINGSFKRKIYNMIWESIDERQGNTE